MCLGGEEAMNLCSCGEKNVLHRMQEIVFFFMIYGNYDNF